MYLTTEYEPFDFEALNMINIIIIYEKLHCLLELDYADLKNNTG